MPKSLNKYKFNWTLSYPMDSEIADCSYGCMYESVQASDSEAEMERRTMIDRQLEREFHKRKNTAVWFVSNCDANFRNEFALALKAHIDVHIYGKCRDQFLLNIKNRNLFHAYSFFRPLLDLISLPFNIVRYVFNLNNYRYVNVFDIFNKYLSRFY